MPQTIDSLLKALLNAPFHFGQILVRKSESGGFVLVHRDDESLHRLQTYRDSEDAVEIAKYDDAGDYRPLKTAPNLQHGWRLELADLEQLTRALDYFYPGRLAAFAALESGYLKTTALRETLNRQSGMYRVAAKISDEGISDVVAEFCRSDGGCLRTILWKRDRSGVIASPKLPEEKFDPACDQVPASAAWAAPATAGTVPAVPLLCQEACNLLVAECRKIVKRESAPGSSDGT